MFYSEEFNMTLFTDIEYIEIGIANSFGKDKLNWAERLLWVEENRDNLWNLVSQADEPYQYRKALHALEDAKAGKPTGYAIGLDSTASGVQMFACLSGCVETAKAVNLIGDGVRHDLYSDVGRALEVDVDRSVLKKCIMTHFYQSQKLQEETFGEELGKFYAAMEQTLPGASEVLDIAKKCQRILKADRYAFKTPGGDDVLIRQRIMKDYKIEAKTEVKGLKNYYFVQRREEFGKKVNAKGQSTDKSIAANIAHVCDGWFAKEIITRCKKEWGFDVYHVHDQFFCSPTYANRMRWVAREVLADLCEMDYLQEVVRNITGITDYEYEKKSNNLAELVRKADYHIC